MSESRYVRSKGYCILNVDDETNTVNDAEKDDRKAKDTSSEQRYVGLLIAFH